MTWRSDANSRPKGIIRNLPWASAKVLGYKPTAAYRRASLRRVCELFRLLESGEENSIYLTMPAKPQHEVLYCYVLVDGRIRWRVNIAAWEPGGPRECVDGIERSPKWWMILTGPLVRPPEKIRMRGFRGFRYTVGFDGF